MFAAVPEKERNKSVEGGDSITLQCGVSDPSAEVHWFKDGEPVVVQDGVEIQAQGNQRTLVIQSADFHHAGMYTCQSSDDVSVFQVDITGDKKGLIHFVIFRHIIKPLIALTEENN